MGVAVGILFLLAIQVELYLILISDVMASVRQSPYFYFRYNTLLYRFHFVATESLVYGNVEIFAGISDLAVPYPEIYILPVLASAISISGIKLLPAVNRHRL